MDNAAVEEVLKKCLGCEYGGPSISYDNGKFLVYTWNDAPVGMETICEDTTFAGLIEKMDKMLQDFGEQ